MNLERVDGSSHPGRLELEQHLFAGDRRSATAVHVESCAQCAAAVREMTEQRDAFLRDIPTAQGLQPALERLDLHRTTQRPPRLWPLVPLVAAAAVIALVLLAPWRQPPQGTPDPLRLKGGAALSTLILSGSSWQPPPPGHRPAAGQEVRFSVYLVRPGYPAAGR